MARNRNGNYTFSGKPCDIEYRLKRASELLGRLEACLRSIDPEALEGNTLLAVVDTLPGLSTQIQGIRDEAPEKRAHNRRSDADIAEAKRQKAEKAAARAAKRAERAAKKRSKGADPDVDLATLDAFLQDVEGAVADAAE